MAIGGRSGEEANRDADVAISTVKYHSTNSALISSFSLNYKYHTHKWRPTPTRLCFVAVADYFPIAVGTPIPILSTTIITHPLLLLLASLPLLIPPTIAQPITGNSSISPEAAANHLYNLTAYAYLIFSLWAYLHLAGVKSIWKRKSLKAEAMSKTQGNLSSPRAITKVEDKPEHLIVLVHGILASPSDWTYFEAELKRRLGKKFLIHEEMIRGLQRLGWIKVDVSFRSAFWPFFAHYNIHVKNEWLHNAGAGVVAHVADMIKQQDSAPPIGAGFFCGSALTV
ncbi:UNVERIFIED_CONTAM: hypothetical protein Scaly_1301000 [Sesamum calycinum]|uniref:DUF676 domain-containing protein n=1 Tax=Sesamum calycinum TaxID=2727403 RepID=A0AAW2Q799_9LAMI